MDEKRYLEPGWFTKNVFNRSVQFLTRHGVSVMGSRVLRVKGRKSGEWRSTPVNLMTLNDGSRYLVAPRGNAQWVRNMRSSGGGELRLGKRVETFAAVEVADQDKVPVLREYITKWGWEVGAFFEGVDKKSSDEKLLEIAPGFPVFSVQPV